MNVYREIIKCYKYDLLNFKPRVGAIYYCRDTRKLYKDYSNDISGRRLLNAIVILNDQERLSIKPVVGKLYYVEDKNTLWLYEYKWTLKIGDPSEYNSYTYYDGVASPVISNDENVTGKYGDKIIDNNGLLGDGSVVVRDENRIVKSRLGVDNVNQELLIQSYLNDGILFVPNAHSGLSDTSTSNGTLHLTVDRSIKQGTNIPSYSGQAYYYGTLHTSDYIYNVTKKLVYNTEPDYIPNDEEILKHFITCSKTISVLNENTNEYENKVVKTKFVIRPISDRSALIHIISYYDGDETSVVINDIGEMIFTHKGELLDNNIYEAVRTIDESEGIIYSKYTISNYEDGYIVISKENQIYVSDTWCDDESNIELKIYKYINERVLNTGDLEELKNIINNNNTDNESNEDDEEIPNYPNSENEQNSLYKKIKLYETLSVAKVDESLKPGDVILTQGYHIAQDGGHAYYLIKEKSDEIVIDGYKTIDIGNLIADMILINDEINVKALGATENNENNGDIFNYCMNNFDKIFIPKGNYNILSSLNFSNLNNKRLYGESKLDTIIKFTTDKGIVLTDCSNLNLSNFSIEGNFEIVYNEDDEIIYTKDNDNDEYGNCGLLLQNVKNSSFDNISISKFKSNGLEIYAGDDGRYSSDDCIFEKCDFSYNNYNGVACYGYVSNPINHMIIKNSNCSYNGFNGILASAKCLKIEDCVFNENLIGVTIQLIDTLLNSKRSIESVIINNSNIESDRQQSYGYDVRSDNVHINGGTISCNKGLRITEREIDNFHYISDKSILNHDITEPVYADEVTYNSIKSDLIYPIPECQFGERNLNGFALGSLTIKSSDSLIVMLPNFIPYINNVNINITKKFGARLLLLDGTYEDVDDFNTGILEVNKRVRGFILTNKSSSSVTVNLVALGNWEKNATLIEN